MRVELVQPGTGAVFEFAEDTVADALERGYTRVKQQKPAPAPAAGPKRKTKK